MPEILPETTASAQTALKCARLSRIKSIKARRPLFSIRIPQSEIRNSTSFSSSWLIQRSFTPYELKVAKTARADTNQRPGEP